MHHHLFLKNLIFSPLSHLIMPLKGTKEVLRTHFPTLYAGIMLCVALPRGAMGLSAVYDCGIS